MEWALDKYRKTLAPEKKSQRRRGGRLQGDKDQVRRVDRELLLVAKRPQLLRARQQATRHVENLLIKTAALLRIERIKTFPQIKRMAEEVCHPLVAKFMNAKPTVAGCVRFDQVLQEPQPVLDFVIAKCAEAKTQMLSNPVMSAAFAEICEEGKLDYKEQMKRFASAADRMWLHLIRFTLAHRIVRSTREAEQFLEEEQMRSHLRPASERDALSGLIQDLEQADRLMHELNYHASCISDSYLFMFEAFESSKDRVIDPHLEIATAGVCEANLPVLTEVVERAFTTTDEAGKRSAFVHVFQKLRPRRSQRRMWKDTLDQKTEKDPGMFEYVTKAVMCSLLGNYMQMPSSGRPSLYTRLVLTKGGSRMILFLWYHIESLSYHAMHQHMFYLVRGVPHILQHCCNLFEFRKLSNDVDRLMKSTSMRIADRTEQLEEFFEDAIFDYKHPPHKMRDATLSINSAMETESVKMLLAVTYPKERRGFLSALSSKAKALEQAKHRKKTPEKGDDEKKQREGEMKLSKAQEKAMRKDLGGLCEDLSAHTEDRPASSAIAAEMDLAAAQNKFGLQDDMFDGLRAVVEASEPNSNCPEAYLFKCLPVFGAPEAAVRKLSRICADFEAGINVDTELTAFAHSYPHSFALASAFGVLYKRRAVFTLNGLPSRYIKFQLQAVKKRFKVPDCVDAVPQEGIELLYCEVCLGLYSDVRDMFGRYHIFGRDAGYNNVKVDIDPLKPSVQKFCNGNMTFAGVSCWEQPLKSINILGKSLLYRDETVIICPQPGCGMPSVICPYRSAVTEYGVACSDCTLCLAAASIDLEAAEIEGYLPMTHFACRLLKDQLEGSAPVIGCRKKQSKIPCDVCCKLKLSKDMQTVELNEMQFRMCRSHKHDNFGRWLETTSVSDVPKPECAQDGKCHCDGLEERCFQEVTRDMVLKFLRVNNNAYYFLSKNAQKMQKRMARAPQRKKSKGKSKRVAK